MDSSTTPSAVAVTSSSLIDMPAASDFQLHERLAADTVSLGRTRLCEVRLMNDRAWPWVILVPAVPGIREIYELELEDQQRLLAESSALSKDMMARFDGDKMNVAALHGAAAYIILSAFREIRPGRALFGVYNLRSLMTSLG